MEKSAPFADMPIMLSVQSNVGMRYRSYECVECGLPFLERDNDTFYRSGSSEPESAHIDAGGTIPATCPRCAQKYTVVIALGIQQKREGIPLYMQPQSIFMSVESSKKLRDIYCGECGKAFFSVSDRIRMIVDNTTPEEMLDTTRYGPMEARCKFHQCKQRWYIRV